MSENSQILTFEKLKSDKWLKRLNSYPKIWRFNLLTDQLIVVALVLKQNYGETNGNTKVKVNYNFLC